MLKVGDKIKITDRYSTFGGEVLTVQREDGPGRFVCTTPKYPRCDYIAYSRDNGRLWVYAKETQDNDKPYPWIKDDVRYYAPALDSQKLYEQFIYDDDSLDKRLILRGLVFRTAEEAIEASKKMLAVLKEG